MLNMGNLHNNTIAQTFATEASTLLQHRKEQTANQEAWDNTVITNKNRT